MKTTNSEKRDIYGNTLRQQDINAKKPWYKSPAFPWGIIITVALVFAGIVTGWTLRGDMNQRIDSEVAKRFESSKTNQ